MPGQRRRSATSTIAIEATPLAVSLSYASAALIRLVGTEFDSRISL